jgi:acyl carrier protein
MSKDEILDGLTDVVRDILEQPDLSLSRGTTAQDVEGWDSVNNISIIVGTEARFGVKFRTAELDEIKKVGDLIDLVADKLQKKK